MKIVSLLAGLLALTMAWSVAAQSNPPPVRLAIVPEDASCAVAADLLTATLSQQENLQLLERAEIEKVYREQSLSATGQDSLKLGRTLGADGVLSLRVVAAPDVTNLMVQLIAVKPGVILIAPSFPLPLCTSSDWASTFVPRLHGYWPKLSVLAKDAIPLSVVNLRSAIQSPEGIEAEKQLKLLAIQRLSQEPRFFVLDRERMQSLSEEKERNADESSFWDGSYLLEGILDQNGYAKDSLTLNARLTPPKGGAPLLLEVSGSRTNYTDVISRLAARIAELLRINSTLREWNAADEAQQYYEEATWALKWGQLAEAQVAADSAWALGKRDVDCASVRIKSHPFTTLFGFSGRDWPHRVPAKDLDATAQFMKQDAAGHLGAFCSTYDGGIKIVYIELPPQGGSIDQALTALELYYNFSRTLPEMDVKPGSDWCRLGVDELIQTSELLEHYYLAPGAQPPAAPKLAALRANARLVAQWLSAVPSVHTNYFVGDRLTTQAEMTDPIVGEHSLFRCMVTWGSLWQETPEDCVALYRNLMASPVFYCIHTHLWSHHVGIPLDTSSWPHRLEPARLIAWNPADRPRLVQVWSNYVQELAGSTNVLLRLEAKALRLADMDKPAEVDLTGDVLSQLRAQAANSPTDIQLQEAFDDLMNSILENRSALIVNNVELMHGYWGIRDLIHPGLVDARGRLWGKLWDESYPKLSAIDRDYRDQTIPKLKLLAQFENQKQYLSDFSPYDFFRFTKLFELRNYSTNQAREILPLIQAYRSNLLHKAEGLTGMAKFQAQSGDAPLRYFESQVHQILDPPRPPPTPVHRGAASAIPHPVQIASPTTNSPPPTPQPVTTPAAPVLLVNHFLRFPVESVPDAPALSSHGEKRSFGVLDVHWSSGMLILDVAYDLVSRKERPPQISHRVLAAVYNPANDSWRMVHHPPAAPGKRFPGFSTKGVPAALYRDCLYVAQAEEFTYNVNSVGTDERLLKYDFQTQQWEQLDVPKQGTATLAVVNDHLYKANSETIMEIADGGKSLRLLASTRRRPVVTTLDALDSLGTPLLFSGPDNSLRAFAGNKAVAWNGSNWNQLAALEFPRFSLQEQASGDAAILRYRASDSTVMVWLWGKSQPAPQLFGYEEPKRTAGAQPMFKPEPPPAKPLWTPHGLDSFQGAAGTCFNSNFYLLVINQALFQPVSPPEMGQQRRSRIEHLEYHAKLVCWNGDGSTPVILPLKFDLEQVLPAGQSPMPAHLTMSLVNVLPTWLCFTERTLYLGNPAMLDIWTIPTAEVRAAVEEQKLRQPPSLEQIRTEVLLKYDHNHNGLLDPEEKAVALSDSLFLESQVDKIDANHNGVLDAQELVWFDANTNGVLEPKEQAGIEATQHLLAQKLLKQFDANDDGRLDRAEFDELARSLDDTSRPAPAVHRRPLDPFPNTSQDRQMDAADLESFLDQRLRRQLRTRTLGSSAMQDAVNTDPSIATDPRRYFKTSIEVFWHTPDHTTGAPALRSPLPFASGHAEPTAIQERPSN